MSYFYWKRREPLDKDTDPNHSHEPALPVDEQHALPTTLYFPPDGATEAEEVGYANPLPVQQIGEGVSYGKLYVTPFTEIPGIAASDAFDANDAFGTPFQLVVPVAGTIVQGMMLDLSDQGLTTELWCFAHDFTTTASDAEIGPLDADLDALVAVVSISTFFNAASNQVGQNAVSLPYVAPEGRLYVQAVTRGTPTIVAGGMPKVQLKIEVKG